MGTVNFDHNFYTNRDLEFLRSTFHHYQHIFTVKFESLAEVIARLHAESGYDCVNNFVVTFKSENPTCQIVIDVITSKPPGVRYFPGVIICAPPQVDIISSDGSTSYDRTAYSVDHILQKVYIAREFTSKEDGEETNLYLAKKVAPDRSTLGDTTTSKIGVDRMRHSGGESTICSPRSESSNAGPNKRLEQALPYDPIVYLFHLCLIASFFMLQLTVTDHRLPFFSVGVWAVFDASHSFRTPTGLIGY